MTDAENPEPYGVRLTSLGEMELGGLKAHYFQLRQGREILQVEGFRVDPEAVRMVAFGSDGSGRVEPPMTVLRLPPKAGDAWRWQGMLRSEDGDVRASAEFRVSGPEQVETPAGSFPAFRVDRIVTRAGEPGGQPIRNTQWYAAGVGLVKQVVREPGGDTATVLVKQRVRPSQTPEGAASEVETGTNQQPAGR